MGDKVKELKKFATQIRIETVKQVATRGFGHLGGALSVVDVLAVLYGDVMNIDPKNPNWEKRDKVVVSKGHAGPALYSALALKGYFPMDWLKTLNQPGTKLPSHCDKNLTPGVDMTTGSLGQGMSSGIGLAMAQKLDGLDSKTYIFIGDGESNERQVCEGALFAPHHKLDNLTVFVDYNHKQLDGGTEEVLCMGDMAAKFESFDWHTLVIDGHDVEQIQDAIAKAHAEKERPTCIILNTVKGKGVKFLEEMEINHHVTVSAEQEAEAVADLETLMESIERGDA